jgi:sugar-specific transcriptional regulator TrmB
MDLQKILIEIGLSNKEAKVYLTLLTYSEALASTIASKADIKRPTAYVILESLCKKGLATKVTKRKTLYYQSVSPHNLLDTTYNKFRKLEMAIPEMLKMHSLYLSKPNVSFYEGLDGLMQIMDDTLMYDKEVLCWANADVIFTGYMKDYYLKRYIPAKIEKKVWVRAILNYDKEAVKLKKRGECELREVFMIPKDDYLIKNEINIYGDKVAIISHQDKIGVVIQNQSIADTQKSIFKLAYKYAKLVEPTILTEDDKRYLADL